MTNAELIAKIKAEIERNRQGIKVLNEHTAPEQMSKTCAIFQYSDSILSELLSFLSTLESERPINQNDELNDEIKRFVAEYGYERSEDILLITIVARHFYELGKQSGSSEKPNQDELEKEIGEYMSNEDNNPFDWDWRDKRDCARHFAEWGAEHSGCSEIPNDLEEAAEKFARFYDQGTCDGVAQDCFIAGAKWQYQKDRGKFAQIKAKTWCEGFDACKEQMLKEAVEGKIAERVQGKLYARCQVPKTMGVEFGDKVKLIIINGDGKSDWLLV